MIRARRLWLAAVASAAVASGAGALEYTCPDGHVCETYVGCPCLHKCANGAPVTDPKFCPEGAAAQAPAQHCPTEYRLAAGAVLCVQRADLAAWAGGDEKKRAELRGSTRCFLLSGVPIDLVETLPTDPEATLSVRLHLESAETDPGFTWRRHVEKCE